jgi:hypothetical protein
MVGEVNKLTTIEQMIAQVLEDVKTLKQSVDASQRQITTLREQIGQYKAEYTMFIANLEQERTDLEIRISNCRLKIQQLVEPDTEPDETSELENDEPVENVSSFEEPYIHHEEIDEAPEMDMARVEIDNDSIKKAKKRTYQFFAKRLHPDKQADSSDESIPLLMQELNIINKEAADEVDLLIAIPWGKEWLERGKDEQPGAQIERLAAWKDGLEEAQIRIEQELTRLQQNIYYDGLLQKQEADQRGEDYFAQLANEQIEEIEHLKQTLNDLQMHLAELPEEQADG